MIHLLPLPGAPGWGGSMAEVVDRAAAEARVLTEGAVDALLVENYGDAPFHADRVPPVTVAALTTAVLAVREASDLPCGVNVLRNDATAALGIAAATGAAFVRVNVHVGGMFTDQGWIEGRAAETVRRRQELAPTVAILADVMVKHAVPPAGMELGQAARDAWSRGRADALIVSGSGTGEPTSPDDVRTVRHHVADATVLVGSGMTPDTAGPLMALADGAIIGSAFRRDGRAGQPVDPDRVARLVAACRAPRA